MNKKGFNPIIEVQDDGLPITDVGEWSEEKYKLMGLYCDIFTTSMHKKWENLIYIDLYAGSGYARIEKTTRIIKSSPLIALSIPNSFTKCIFSEKDMNLMSVLKKRVLRDFKNK